MSSGLSAFDALVTAPSTRSNLARTALEDLPPVSDILQLQEQLNIWDSTHLTEGFDAVSLLQRVATILERATEDFLQLNPDPLDDRHPSRTHPSASFGVMLKAIIRKENLMSMLVNSYLMCRDNVPLQESAARVLLSCVPGLDSDTVFSDPEELIPCLYKYAAIGGSDALQAYSYGLLASAMEVQDNAGKYRKQNSELIPSALRHLQRMRGEMGREMRGPGDNHNSNGDCAAPSAPTDFSRPDSPQISTFTAASKEKIGTIVQENLIPENTLRVRKRATNGTSEAEKRMEYFAGRDSPPRKKKKNTLRPLSPPTSADENSVSQWNVIKHVIIGTHKIYPLTIKMHQRLIIQYLGSIGEYQDMLALAYEGQSMSLLFDYINLEFTDDVRLTFDALKYLCSLLVHRKFALEFVSKQGVAKLLKVPSSSLAAVGVATCFYYLSYGVDVMERLCQLPDKLLDQIVDYMLWVQEHQHESGMASATMFFTQALAFRAILDRFDARDGLRKLYNYMSTLTLLQHGSTDVDLTEEQVQTSTQTIRNTCGALKTYATSHLFVRVEQYRRANLARDMIKPEKSRPEPHFSNTTARHSLIVHPAQHPLNIPYYKPMHMEEETLRQAVWMLAGLHRAHYTNWKAMEELRSVGMLRLLLAMLLRAHEWVSVSAGKIEIAVNSICVLSIAATVPRVQSELCSPVSAEVEVSGLAVIFSLCDDKEYGDGEAVIAALSAIVACVCAPIELDVGSGWQKEMPVGGGGSGGKKKDSSGTSSRRLLYGSSSGKHAHATAELYAKVVATIRKNNGLMTLNTLIHSKTPITSADEIRALTCKIFVGLARHKEVRRILLLLPLISCNELHDLMNEPVCPEKKGGVHAQFCAEAKLLISAVTEKSLKDVRRDLTQDRLWKSHIISSTQISFNERELLQLIHSHLVAKGLCTAANALATEAALENVQQQKLISTETSSSNGPVLPLMISSAASATAAAGVGMSLETLPKRDILTRPPSPSIRNGWIGSGSSFPIEALRFAATPGGRPRRTKDMAATPFPRRLPIRPAASGRAQATVDKPAARPATMQLTDIVTEYFRVQHSNCIHPVSTCPPFSLFHPHRCPEPSQWRRLPQNVTSRWLHSTTYNQRQRLYKKSLDEYFIFSRFRPNKIFTESEENYTACTFSIDDEHVILGTFSGEIQWMNMESGLCEATAQCHHSAISGIIPSKDGSMLLTSGLFMNPQSTLWRLGAQQTHLMDFPEETVVTFNNADVQDRIVGTTNEKATVYDIETGRTLHTLQNVDKNGEYYQYCKAAFSPYDDMILHDNTLYDLRSKSIVREFDRLNPTNGGCFHPHGNEIIINTEVWDLRSPSLLHSVPTLDQCRLTFNATGNVILAGAYAPRNDDPYKMQFSSAIRTISSMDYSVISTLDMRKPLMDFCLSHEDGQLALVEVVRTYANSEYFAARSDETACRTYEVGKMRVPEDGEEDGEADEDVDGGNDRDSEEEDGSGSDDDEEEDSSDSDDDRDEDGSSGSEGALQMLGRMAGESDENDEEESDVEDESQDDDDDDGNSSGWETASNQEDGGDGEEVAVDAAADNSGDEEEGDDDENILDGDSSDGSMFMGDGSDEEDDEDPAFNPDTDERGGTSNIILNPNLRKRK